MDSINKILLPTDFSDCANAALPWAIMLAKNLDAELIMFHAVVLHGDDVGEEVYSRFPDLKSVFETLLHNADTRLEKAIPDPGRVRVRQEVRRGYSAADEILSIAGQEKVDLVVTGTHGRRGLRHMLMGSVAERVMREADCPMLMVHHAGGEVSDVVDVHRVVLPIDFSDFSKLAVRYASTLAGMLDADLDVVHVIDQSIHPSFYAIGKDSIFELDDELRQRAEKSVSDFMAEAGAQVPFKAVILEGKPSAQVAQFAAESKNSLVVMASHGTGAIERIFVGSTAERVVRRASCPVLIVKPGERDFIS